MKIQLELVRWVGRDEQGDREFNTRVVELPSVPRTGERITLGSGENRVEYSVDRVSYAPERDIQVVVTAVSQAPR